MSPVNAPTLQVNAPSLCKPPCEKDHKPAVHPGEYSTSSSISDGRAPEYVEGKSLTNISISSGELLPPVVPQGEAPTANSSSISMKKTQIAPLYLADTSV